VGGGFLDGGKGGVGLSNLKGWRSATPLLNVLKKSPSEKSGGDFFFAYRAVAADCDFQRATDNTLVKKNPPWLQNLLESWRVLSSGQDAFNTLTKGVALNGVTFFHWESRGFHRLP
jgi:hypothetical protein